MLALYVQTLSIQVTGLYLEVFRLILTSKLAVHFVLKFDLSSEEYTLKRNTQSIALNRVSSGSQARLIQVALLPATKHIFDCMVNREKYTLHIHSKVQSSFNPYGQGDI